MRVRPIRKRIWRASGDWVRGMWMLERERVGDHVRGGLGGGGTYVAHCEPAYTLEIVQGNSMRAMGGLTLRGQKTS